MRCRDAPLFWTRAVAMVRRLALVALVLFVAIFLTFLTVIRPTHAQPSPAEGKAIFEERCVACHTIGGGVLVGPDLQGVTERRARDWLVRFILDPEQLRQAGDPVAQANSKKFGTPMPSFGWARPEIEAVVTYLATATPAAQALPAAYLPTLAIALIALLALTVIALWAGTKRVEVRP